MNCSNISERTCMEEAPADDREDRILDVIDELWEEVESHKDEGPAPVLRALAERVVDARDDELARIAHWLDGQIDEDLLEALKKGGHRE